MASAAELADRLLQGDVRSLARACRIVDDRLEGQRELLGRIYPHARRGWVIGVTGSPGVGKSTLCDRLIAAFRARGERVGVVAVDPSSPFAGGALLGDRIRLQRHFEDPEVFIRSLATRGAVGGLSRSAVDVVRLVRAWGAGVTLIETVGVGQDELDVCRAAQTTLVVLAPGLGDGLQALKAGIVEIADVFAVNKADREGADRAQLDLELALELATRLERKPPIVCTAATSGQGTSELVQALDEHRQWLETPAGRERLRAREYAEIERSLRLELGERLLADYAERISAAAARVEAGELTPYDAVDELVDA